MALVEIPLALFTRRLVTREPAVQAEQPACPTGDDEDGEAEPGFGGHGWRLGMKGVRGCER